jgi:probable HAF family extracellular repeat protein
MNLHRTPSLRPLALLLLAGALWALSTAAGAQAYTFQRLDAFGGRYDTGTDVNAAGQVAGLAGVTHEQNAVLWSGGTTTYLGLSNTMQYAIGAAAAINKHTQVVGTDTGRAVLWNGTTTPTLLADLGGVGGAANGINDGGQIVGYSLLASGGAHAALWNGNTAATDLGTLGGVNSYAQDINQQGWIVGASELAGSTGTHAVLWSAGQATDLGIGYATALNDAGQIVGNGETGAVVWNGGVATALGGFGTLLESNQPADINNRGQVVGTSFGEFLGTVDGDSRATLWQGTQAVDLSSFLSRADRDAGWALSTALGINDRGWITGSAYNALTFERVAYLLVPAVPEPGGLLMLACGTAMLVGMARRRKSLTVA